MDKPIEHYWQLRLQGVKEALEANHFEVFLANDVGEARKIVKEQILPATGARAFLGGSMTFRHRPLREIKKMPGLEFSTPLIEARLLKRTWNSGGGLLLPIFSSPGPMP
jgi:hypothetical protein